MNYFVYISNQRTIWRKNKIFWVKKILYGKILRGSFHFLANELNYFIKRYMKKNMKFHFVMYDDNDLMYWCETSLTKNNRSSQNNLTDQIKTRSW